MISTNWNNEFILLCNILKSPVGKILSPSYKLVFLALPDLNYHIDLKKIRWIIDKNNGQNYRTNLDHTLKSQRQERRDRTNVAAGEADQPSDLKRG